MSVPLPVLTLAVASLVLATLAAARAALLASGGGVTPVPGRWLLLPPPAWLGARLAETGLEADPGRAWSAWLLASVVASGAALAAGGPGLGVVSAGAACAVPVAVWLALRHRGEGRLEAALPAAVDAIARGLRSGASLRQAVAEAAGATPGDVGRDLAQVAAATERGAALVASLEEWARRRPLAGVRLVVSALSLAAEMGGATAQAVDGVADTLRQRLSAGAEARSLATQARASAAVIAAAPLAFCAMASAADPRTVSFLFRTGPGLTFLTAGLALDLVGALWMARITRVEA